MKDDEGSATENSDKENDNGTHKSKDVSGNNKKIINEVVVKPPQKRNRHLVKIGFLLICHVFFAVFNHVQFVYGL